MTKTKESKSRRKIFGGNLKFSFLKKKPVDPSSEAAYKKLRKEIDQLQEEKAVAQSKIEQMELEKCVEKKAFIKERDDLQVEVTKLQRMIEDLKIQLDNAQSELEEAKEKQNILSSIELCKVNGWLWKRGVKGPTGRNWRYRWFTSENDGRLYYYRKGIIQLIPRGSIDLERITAVQDLPASEENVENSCFNVVIPSRTYEMKAKDEEEKLRWMDALNHLIYWAKRKASCNEGHVLCTDEKP